MSQEQREVVRAEASNEQLLLNKSLKFKGTQDCHPGLEETAQAVHATAVAGKSPGKMTKFLFVPLSKSSEMLVDYSDLKNLNSW
ncbi:hypothetical protein J5N97_009208 [Dioscorea zingiberensis]|uniref:Uncharacterized protein n=1 Tax=Dioscorea zingiberensis TaxID=325984 RepID=A0A9D5CX51_9LILI|nr:hypothetical protein J5N97_009208 [Dioscorea zingiberensis]